jgi:hypothetical protein
MALFKRNEKLDTPSSRICAMVMNFLGEFLVGVCRHSVRELHPTSVSRMKTQYVESLVVEVDIRYKPLLKASELLLLLLLLHHDDKPLGIPRSVWRWSG